VHFRVGNCAANGPFGAGDRNSASADESLGDWCWERDCPVGGDVLRRDPDSVGVSPRPGGDGGLCVVVGADRDCAGRTGQVGVVGFVADDVGELGGRLERGQAGLDGFGEAWSGCDRGGVREGGCVVGELAVGRSYLAGGSSEGRVETVVGRGEVAPAAGELVPGVVALLDRGCQSVEGVLGGERTGLGCGVQQDDGGVADEGLGSGGEHQVRRRRVGGEAAVDLDVPAGQGPAQSGGVLVRSGGFAGDVLGEPVREVVAAVRSQAPIRCSQLAVDPTT